jgi:hypothetical protein
MSEEEIPSSEHDQLAMTIAQGNPRKNERAAVIGTA